MRIIRTTNKRGAFYTVNGLASFISAEIAVEIAFDSLAEEMAARAEWSLWTVYS